MRPVVQLAPRRHRDVHRTARGILLGSLIAACMWIVLLTGVALVMAVVS